MSEMDQLKEWLEEQYLESRDIHILDVLIKIEALQKWRRG